MVASISEFSLLLIFSWMQFLFVTVVPKYLNFAAFSKDLLANLYIVVLSCNLVMKHDHTLCFLCAYV
jgi:hypothetical protein